ncbi:hypothetical protein [Nocardioides bigeumensis]|uniref:Uncharacterized protein n=1 Tax=Nocardioides bigeumensis TaxID=433657 RepID=A0ABN2XS87_9ACTN
MTGPHPLGDLSPDDLRAAVRAVLRDVLPDGLVAAPTPPAPPAGPQAGQGDVVIGSDGDLTAFVRRVAALCEDPHVRTELQGGRHGFRLADRSETVRASGPGHDGSVTRIDRGAVTERAVVRAAAAGTRLVLGRGAVLTPLARDKARTLGVQIEKER